MTIDCPQSVKMRELPLIIVRRREAHLNLKLVLVLVGPFLHLYNNYQPLWLSYVLDF